jgi:hypothetical protein
MLKTDHEITRNVLEKHTKQSRFCFVWFRGFLHSLLTTDQIKEIGYA